MKEIEKFIEWLPANVKEFEGMSGEEIVEAVNALDKNDPDTLKQLIIKFKDGVKKHETGGKIDYLLKTYRK